MKGQLPFAAIAILLQLLTASETLAAAKSIKKAAKTTLPFFASMDAGYFNWQESVVKGGGETRSIGLELGLNLPWNIALFSRFSYLPEPAGIQDTKLGATISQAWLQNWRATMASSYALPTSSYSREMQQKAQALLSFSLEYFLARGTLSTAVYGLQAYYKEPAAITHVTSFGLRGNRRKTQTPLSPEEGTLDQNQMSRLEATPAESSSDLMVRETYYTYRLHRLYGMSLGYSHSLSTRWFLDTSLAAVQSHITLAPRVWTTEVNLAQVSYRAPRYSVYGATGWLEDRALIAWPRAPTYSTGVTYTLY